MANPFLQGKNSQLNVYEQRYRTSRINLLLVVVFTAVNLLLLVTNSESYFLFSAFFPYFITSVGMFACGRFPEEYYADGFEDMAVRDTSFFVVLLIISVVITLLYLLAWIFSSKNRVGWLIFALVLFGLDTVGMFLLNGISLESAIDILFHAWILYYLILGIVSHHKLKNLPSEEASLVLAEDASQDPLAMEMQNSAILRIADRDVKHRVLLATQTMGYDICYRRVKHTNELVINGNVYDQYDAVIEFPHMLEAKICGHCIVAGYTGTHSIISVDGSEIAKKIRL